jgi:hypothetical protein
VVSRETAQQQAGRVRDDAAQAGQRVSDVARQEAHDVGAEATGRGKDLWHQARSELNDHAAEQQHRVSRTLHQFADDLSSMADGSQEHGMAADLVRRASGRAQDAAGWLDRDPHGLLEEVKGFARRRPGTFLAVAAGIGFAAARMGRGVRDDAQRGPEGIEHSTSGGYSAYGSGAGTSVPPEPTGPVTSERPNDPSAWTGDATGVGRDRGTWGGTG